MCWATISTLRKGFTVAFKASIKVLGPIMIASANFLLGCVAYGFIFYIIPEVSGGSFVKMAANILIGLVFLINILFNYMACAFTLPGSPDYCDNPVIRLGGKMTVNNEGNTVMHFRRCVETQTAVSWRWCRHCKCIKPPRAHHDSISSKCVYHMDHYCPWMNNCVGRDNYRFFFLFLFYLFYGACWAIYMCWICMNRFISNDGPYGNDLPSVHLRNHTSFCFTIALSAAFAVGILFFWHVYLVLTNQTTIEFYINLDEASHAKSQGEKYKNPFDKGWRRNLTRVFGDSPWYTYLLIRLDPVQEDDFEPYPPRDALMQMEA